MFDNLIADIRRYYNQTSTGKHFVWQDFPSLFAILVYRFGHWASKRSYVVRKMLYVIYFPLIVIVRLFTGIQISKFSRIGKGLRIHHFGLLIVNGGVKIGNNCTLRPGVVIGNLHNSNDIPELGDDIEVGVGAKILGRIKIGNHVKIGANAVVVHDIPDCSTAVGIPAKIICLPNEG